MLRALPLLLFPLLLLALFGSMLAQRAERALAQQSDLDRQAREIALSLRCPVCQNLSVADSPSPLAVEMRGIIRQRLEAGESRDSIVRYFVASYGEGILLDPPREGFTLLLWLGAVVSVVGGLLLVAIRVRRALPGHERAARPHSASDALPSLPDSERVRYEAMLDAELASHRQGEGA